MSFIEIVRSKLQSIEADEAVTSFETALNGLRTLGLDDFGYVLMSMPAPEFPRLSRLLPRMASESVQRSWTGASGEVLLRQSCAFVRAVAYNYARLRQKGLEGASILDFGCGYGRIARLMYYFSDPGLLIGVDPWDKSVELCRADGLGENFRLSAYLPTSLPVGEMRFDLIYAFSVFTHLSERATRTCFSVLRDYLKPDGILVITIRPIEYWRRVAETHNPGVAECQMKLHRETGFSFLPHNRPPIDGDVTYGDTSLTIEWLAQACPYFSIVAVDRSLEDPLQYYVFLQHLR